MPDAVPVDGGAVSFEPQRVQFGLDAGSAPEGIGFGHAADEGAEIPGNAWTAREVAVAPPSSVVPEALSLPAQHGLWADHDEGFPPSAAEGSSRRRTRFPSPTKATATITAMSPSTGMR